MDADRPAGDPTLSVGRVLQAGRSAEMCCVSLRDAEQAEPMRTRQKKRKTRCEFC